MSEPFEDLYREVPECGESYDHDLRVIDERDGIRTEECHRCGAELVSVSDGS